LVNYLAHHRAFRSLPLAIMMVLFFLSANCFPGAREDQFVRVGLEFFPSLIAADQDISTKTGADGKLLLVLLYKDQKEAAETVARHLEAIETFRDIPIRIVLTNDSSFKTHQDTPIAGIFITQELGRELDAVIDYGKAHNSITFSPFEGDVERGVLGGISISDRILPYVNMDTMQRAGIRIKPFFLRIAERYER
jgi:hypothetical protein